MLIRASSVPISGLAAVSLVLLTSISSSALSADSSKSATLHLSADSASYEYLGELFTLDLRSNNGALIESMETRTDGTELHMTVIQDVAVNLEDFTLKSFEEIETIPELGGDINQVTTDDGTSILEEIYLSETDEVDLEPVLFVVKTSESAEIAVPQDNRLVSFSDATNSSEKTSSHSLRVSHLTAADIQVTVERSGIEQTFTVPLLPPGVNAPAAVSTTGVDFRYSTFITPNRVSAPVVCGNLANRTFNGNNRGWRAATNTGYTQDKTRMWAGYTWASKKLTTERFVGRTYRYAPNGTIEAQATASNAGQKFSGIQTTNVYLRFVADHSVGNPLCSVAGPIWYTSVVAIWKNGTYSIQGRNVSVPRHEITIRNLGSSTNKIVRRSEASSFICLNLGPPICPAAQSFNLSGTY